MARRWGVGVGEVSLVPILGIAFIGIMSMKVDTNSLIVHLI